MNSRHCSTCSCPAVRADDRHELLAAFSPERLHHLEELERVSERTKKALFDLRGEHNASLPINHLPIEILSRIMVLAQNTRVNTVDEWHQSSEWSPECVQVCSHWRSVALGTSGLWNRLNLQRPELAVALCERFTRIPLCVVYDAFDAHPTSETVLKRIIFQQPSRISELELWAQFKVILPTLRQFQSYAPVLRTLHLASAKIIELDQEKELFECLKGLHAPNLHSLVLYNFPSFWPWASRWFRSLDMRCIVLIQNLDPEYVSTPPAL
ncbi:hypothetical protein PUNSTDRAFT_48323, partial [Punctularia strigosozonata HHB-11173 SS5]|uniref:uncharacterized protein n=1 Tax=Punctularia strigosozonata (strain HHB-11173) TaxID=741275 RepID=UPI0004417A8C